MIRKCLTYLARITSQSLTKKYLTFFLVLLLVPVFIGYHWIVQSAQQIMEQDIIKKNILYTGLFAKRLDTELIDVVYQLQLISAQANQASIDPETMFLRAKQTIAHSSMVYSIYYLDAAKNVVFEAPFHPRLEPPIHYDYPGYNLARWSLNYVISDYISNYKRSSTVSIAIPLTAKNRQFKGLLVAELNSTYLSEVLRKTIKTIGGFGYITDSQGIIMASTDPQEIGTHYQMDSGKIDIFEDSSGVIHHQYKREESIITYQKLIGGWRMVMGVPKRIAFHPIFELSIVLTICFAALLLLSLLCIWAAMRNILYPIVKLTHLVGNTNQEQSLQEIKKMKRFRSSDELGILIRSIVEIGLSNLNKQKMLLEKEKFLGDVIEGIPYALVTMNNTGSIMQVNLQFEKLTGFTKDELIGRKIFELPMIEQKSEVNLFYPLLSLNQPEEKEICILDSHGKRHMIKLATSPFYDQNDYALGFIAVLQDISQMKLWEEHARQNERLAVFGQITAGIAHEIKNPLAILSGASELLKDLIVRRSHEKMILEVVEDIGQVVERMDGILNHFLGFTKMKDDEFQTIEMVTLLDELLHLLRINFEQSSVFVEKAYQVTDAKINGKYDRLMQAFLNLFLNNLDAMPGGGVLHVSIEVVTDHRKWLVIKIKDTGIGIQEENMDWLFHPFYSTKEQGSGLGLSIARTIIDEHYGEISIESKVNVGTTFICKFPSI